MQALNDYHIMSDRKLCLDVIAHLCTQNQNDNGFKGTSDVRPEMLGLQMVMSNFESVSIAVS